MLLGIKYQLHGCVWVCMVSCEVTRFRKVDTPRLPADLRKTEDYAKQRSRFSETETRFAVFITKIWEDFMSIRNEIKAQIVRAGFTMQELVDRLAEE